MPEVHDPLASRIAQTVATLCVAPDRFPGTDANTRAVREVAKMMEAHGSRVGSLPFETVGWQRAGAWIRCGDHSIALHPGPFSPPLPETRARLVAAASLQQLAAMDARGAVLLLHGELAAEQLTPRRYPFYDNALHTEILDAIADADPIALIAATGKNPATTGALSPFPLVEDGTFPIPSAYLAETDAHPLLKAAHEGAEACIGIDSRRFPVGGEQVVGVLASAEEAEGEGKRVIVCAHIDTKPDTPGALDNAAGVATMLAVLGLLAADPPAPDVTVHFVPFNGEDHYAAPGEMAYLAAYPPGADVALVINIDGAGWHGGPSAFSTYGLPGKIEAVLTRLLATHSHVAAGTPWMASDHAVFSMRGIPAVAVTSAQLDTMMESILHTPADRPGLVDVDVLAASARVIAELVRAVR